MQPYLVCFALLLPSTTRAADFHDEELGLLWGLSFAPILPSIVLCPLLLSNFWHHHFGKITAFWTVPLLVPLMAMFGFDAGVYTVVHTLVEECIPFILLLLALYTISDGILVWSNLHDSPKPNTALLVISTVLVSVMGTTGVATLMIHPLLEANDNCKHQVHMVVFFIFLVTNIDGGLTLLGDPSPFPGFLKGVEFIWTICHMVPPVLVNAAILPTVFYIFGSILYAREDEIKQRDLTPDSKLQIFGRWNLLLLAGVIGVVLLSDIWKPDHPGFDVLGSRYALPNLVRDVTLLAPIVISLTITPEQVRAGNKFNSEPAIEAGKLSLGIFITISSALATLKAGEAGALHGVVSLVHGEVGDPINTMYFWISGLLSAFLDSAPTYLVFFNMAGGNAQALMTDPLFHSLLAVSMGSTFMGTVAYIDSAPNPMVKAIAEQRKVKMPSFLGYTAWSAVILIPLSALPTVIFFVLQLI